MDSIIDICSEVMNLRSIIYECKQKLEEITDDYKIEVGASIIRNGKYWSGREFALQNTQTKIPAMGFAEFNSLKKLVFPQRC